MATPTGKPVPAAALAGVSLFSGLSARDRKQLAAAMHEVRFPAGTEVTTEGRQGVAFFVVAEGTVTVQVGGEDRRSLGPGDYFGEMALIDRAPRSARVAAATDLRCYGLTAWAFRAFVKEHPEPAWALLETLVRRVRDAESRLA
ncbi:MAG: cyclic nucleotide-binding domain-containing protein [Acidimicrobiales bacterium]